MTTLRAHVARGAVICLSLLGIAASCNKESPPAAEEPRAPAALAEPAPKPDRAAEPAAAAAPNTAAPSTAEPNAAAGAGVSRTSGKGFELVMASTGSHEVGKASEVSIVLDAKEPYHVNDKYPYKFKLKPADGLSYAAEVVGKDQAKLEKMRVTLPVAFTPQKPGRHQLKGQFFLSVCTDGEPGSETARAECLIDKRELALDIDVK